MILHIWDHKTEKHDFTNDDVPRLHVNYLTFCGIWVAVGDVIGPHEDKDDATCESCILLEFEREAKNGTRKNTEISGVA